jgi:hypothetical protein
LQSWLQFGCKNVVFNVLIVVIKNNKKQGWNTLKALQTQEKPLEPLRF